MKFIIAIIVTKWRRNERLRFEKTNANLDVKLSGNTLPHSASKHIVLTFKNRASYI
jgi:hypothetical protein